MKIVDVFEQINAGIQCTNLYYDNTVVLIDNPENSADPHKGVYIVNLKTNSIGKIEFVEPAYGRTLITSDKTIYYASLEKNKTSKSINFFKLSLENSVNSHIAKLPISDKGKIMKSLINFPAYMNSDWMFYGLNNQYLLLGYSEFNQDSFEKIVLLDSNEGKFYPVNPEINEIDSLADFDMANVFVFSIGQKTYFTAKTGTLFSWEKRDVFDRQEIKNNNIETLFFFEVQEFANSIKQNNQKAGLKIIEQVDMNQAITLIGIQESEIVYELADFKKDIHYIKKYNVLDDKYQTIETFPCDYYLTFNNYIYGVIKNEELRIYDIMKGKEIFICDTKGLDPKVVYIDEDVVILTSYNIATHKKEVQIYDSKNFNQIKKIEDRIPFVIGDKNIVLLYKWLINH